MIKKILFHVFFILSTLICTTCKYQLDVKNFIEKGFEVAKFAQEIVFSRSVSYNTIHYLPSGEVITVTVPIGNRHGQALAGTVMIPPGSSGLFLNPPIVKQLAPNKAIIEFTFKADAEPNAASQFLTQPIPLTLGLVVKDQGRPFGNLTIPLYCNTAPVKPLSYMLQYDVIQDRFTFNLPAKTGIHQDLDRIEAVVTIIPDNNAGQPAVRKSSIQLSGTLPRPHELKLADLFGASRISGKRTCALTLYDKTGLSVPLANAEAAVFPVRFKVEGGRGGSLKGTHNSTDKTASGTNEEHFTVEEGDTVSFTALPDANYEVESWSVDDVMQSATGLTYMLNPISAAKTVTVKFRQVAAVIQGTDPESWKKLKTAVAASQDGDTIIIEGEIKATNTADNSGEIVIDKSITIKGKTGKTTDILNANSYHTGTTPADVPATPHRIFKVTGGNLTLKNITLKKGYAGTYDPSNPLASSGAGILLESGSVSLTQVDILNCGAIRTGGNMGKGGGIYIKTGTLTVSGSTLSSNEASDGGGGVYIAGGTVTLTDTEITGNTSSLAHGGGVYVESGSMRIAGTSRITPSTGIDENKTGKNEVFLKTGAKITVNSTLTAVFPIARITPEFYTAGMQVLDGSAVGTEYTKFAVTPQDLSGGSSAEWSITDDGKLKQTSAVIKSGSGAWKKLNEAVAAIPDGGTIVIEGEIEATNAANDSGEIVINKHITIKGKTGASSDKLNAAQLSRIFKVETGSSLHLENLSLIGGKTAAGDPNGGAILMDGANINSTITGCVIGDRNNSAVKNTAVQKGGGIYLNISSASLTVKDTEINSCTANGAAASGGGIYLQSGNLIFDGVVMTGNTALNGKGRAVWIEGGSFKIKDSSTKQTYLDPTNTGIKKPDDVYLASGKKFTVNGILAKPQTACITPENYTAGTQVVEAENGVSIGDVTNKFTVTPQTAPAKNWIIDKGGCLRDFDNIGKDVIAAFDGDMRTTTIVKYDEMIGHLIFYKTSSGNYGVLTITATPPNGSGTNVYNMTFKYKTYKNDGTIQQGTTTVTGTHSFDLDTGTMSTSSNPLTDMSDFFLHNSRNIDPQNHAKFFTQNPPQP